jgi:hypothetical protein
LRFYYSNPNTMLSYLFLFGMDDRGEPLWYYPLPEEERSLRIQSGPAAQGVEMPFETEAWVRHRAGRLRVVALFSDRPLSIGEVRPVALALAAGRAPLTGRIVSHVLALRVVAGTKGQSLSDAPDRGTP